MTTEPKVLLDKRLIDESMIKTIEERLHFTPGNTDFILKELTKKDLS